MPRAVLQSFVPTAYNRSAAGSVRQMVSGSSRSLWLADWSDEEHAAFLSAAPGAQVLRVVPLGTSVAGRRHRLRSYPAYVALAARGCRAARRGGVLVAWQPLAGALALLAPRPWRPPVVLLNPILSEPGTAAAGSLRQRAVLVGARRASAVVVYTVQGLEDAQALGLDPDRLHHVPLGVAGSTGEPGPVDGQGRLLALGRDHRDWEVLAEASRRSGLPVDVAGPDRVPAPLRLVQPGTRAELASLLRSARAVVVPLRDGTRQAGTLAVLDALAAGRPVVATSGPGTVDYVGEAGTLVPPGDAAALAQALAATCDDVTLRRWAAGAAAASAQAGLPAFVRRVEELVSRVSGDAP